MRVGVIGASGYTGGELLRILAMHEACEISCATSRKYAGEKIHKVHPHLREILDMRFENLTPEDVATRSDVVFTALPHGVPMKIVPVLLEHGVKVVDLSGDFRFKSIATYEKYYQLKHEHPEIKAIYGLPELYREKIKKAEVVANPGCYPTAVLLGVLPVLKFKLTDSDIIVDAKSGVTGAGRKPNLELSFCEVNENLKCYKPLIHQHAPEIESIATQITKSKIKIHFSPHLVPINRGILTTIYIKTKPKVAEKDISKAFKIYKNEKFVRVYFDGYLPQIRDVYDTNFCDIGFRFFKKERLLILVTCIDNLMKGASGQAVQNMNIMLGFKEDEGFKN